MDFINKKDIAGAQVGQDGSQVAGTLDGRAGGDLDVDAHLIGHHMRQGGLAQPGRPIKEHMVERFAALAGSCDQDAEVFLDILLPDQVGE